MAGTSFSRKARWKASRGSSPNGTSAVVHIWPGKELHGSVPKIGRLYCTKKEKQKKKKKEGELAYFFRVGGEVS